MREQPRGDTADIIFDKKCDKNVTSEGKPEKSSIIYLKNELTFRNFMLLS